MKLRRIIPLFFLLALPGGSLLAGIPGLDDLLEKNIDIQVVPEPTGGTLPVTTRSRGAAALYRKARQAQWNFNPESAIKLYRDALKKDPTFVRAHVQMSKLQPKRANWHRNQALDHMYLLPKSERMFVQLLLDDRLPRDQLNDLARNYRNDAEIRLYLAFAQHAEGDFVSARNTMLEAVNLYPPSALAWQTLGEQYQALRVHYARLAFEKEQSLVPDRPEPYLALGHYYLKTGSFRKAIHMADMAIDLEPGDWRGFVLMSYSLTMLGDYETAQDLLLHQVQLSRNGEENLEYLVALVDSLIDTGNYPEAIKYLNALYGETSRIYEESELSERLARGGDIYFLNRLGDTYLEYGDYGSAQDVYDNVLRICEAAPDRGRTREDIQNTYRFNTARISLARDNLREARALLGQLQEQETGHPSERLSMQIARLKGEIELASGEPDMAIEYLKPIAEDDPYILYLLARAYDEAGQQDRAKKYYKLALEYRSFDKYQYAFVRHKARAAQYDLDPLGVGPE